jgi:hypothetical protein
MFTIRDEPHDVMRTISGEVVVREPGDVAGAEDDESGHGWVGQLEAYNVLASFGCEPPGT